MHGNNRTTAPEPYAPNGMRCLPVSKFTRFRFSAQTPRPPFPTDSENKDRKIKFKTKMPCRLFDRFRTERRRDRPDKTAGKGQAFRYATLGIIGRSEPKRRFTPRPVRFPPPGSFTKNRSQTPFRPLIGSSADETRKAANPENPRSAALRHKNSSDRLSAIRPDTSATASCAADPNADRNPRPARPRS